MLMRGTGRHPRRTDSIAIESLRGLGSLVHLRCTEYLRSPGSGYVPLVWYNIHTIKNQIQTTRHGGCQRTSTSSRLGVASASVERSSAEAVVSGADETARDGVAVSHRESRHFHQQRIDMEMHKMCFESSWGDGQRGLHKCSFPLYS